MCSALTNNAQRSGRITFVASLLVFVVAQLWGLGAASTPYMLRGPWAEWHTCLPGFCICVYGSGQNSIVELSPQLPHRVAYVQSSTGPWGGGDNGAIVLGIHSFLDSPPRFALAIFCWSVPLDSGRSAPTGRVDIFTQQQLVSVNGRWEHLWRSSHTHRTRHNEQHVLLSGVPLNIVLRADDAFCVFIRFCGIWRMMKSSSKFKMFFCTEAKHDERPWLNFSRH